MVMIMMVMGLYSGGTNDDSDGGDYCDGRPDIRSTEKNLYLSDFAIY